MGTYPDAFDAPSSPCLSLTVPFATKRGAGVMFEAPELPEETLMEVSRRWEESENDAFPGH